MPEIPIRSRNDESSAVIPWPWRSFTQPNQIPCADELQRRHRHEQHESDALPLRGRKRGDARRHLHVHQERRYEAKKDRVDGKELQCRLEQIRAERSRARLSHSVRLHPYM